MWMIGRRHIHDRVIARVVLSAGLILWGPASGVPLMAESIALEAVASSESVSFLMKQLQQLESQIQLLQEEIAASRRETSELRGELHALRLALPRYDNGAQAASRVIPAGHSLPPVGLQMPAGQAQEAASPSGDDSGPSQSLNRIREDQELLSSKLDTLYQTKVESRSKYRVRFSGLALLNVFATRGGVESLDVPLVAETRQPGESNGAFGATIRQSIIGLEIFGPEVAGARTSGELQLDFSGGFPLLDNGVTAGLARIRTGRVRFDWENFSVEAGQEAPPFSPRSPTSLATLAVPALSYAGNMWTWTPQVLGEYRVGLAGDTRLTLQGALLDPLAGETPDDLAYFLPGPGHRGGSPAIAGRVGWSLEAGHEAAQGTAVGLGGYFTKQNWRHGRTVTGWAVTADWQLPLGRYFSFSGELYRGQALGGLGAGEIGSVVWEGDPTNPSTAVTGLHSAGGWAQIKFQPTARMELNWAFGEDVPFGTNLRRFSDLASNSVVPVRRNASSFVNAIYRLRSNLLVSGEFRRIWTTNLHREKPVANQIGLGAGILF